MSMNFARLSHYLAPTTRALALLLPLLSMLLWSIPFMTEMTARHMSDLFYLPLALTPRSTVLACLIATIQISLFAYGFWIMAQVFQLFAQNEPFKTGHHVKRFGTILLISGVLAPLFRTLLGLALTMDNPPNQHYLVIGFSSSDFVLILVGILLMILGLALKQAALIAEENRQIV